MTLQELWNSRRIPLVSGVFFASGEVRTLIENSNNDGRTELIQGKLRNLDEIILRSKASYISIDETFHETFAFNSRSIEIFCGEGGYGSDGFVCATENCEILWLAFFDYSNPFVNASSEGGYVVAKNNCGESWIFPLDSPHEVLVLPHT